MPSKRRRQLNRLKRTRDDLTQVYSTPEDERRPLKGFEDLYEITRSGDVFSLRLKRFIKHKFLQYGDSNTTYIEFSVKGETHQMGVGEAVAATYLSDDDLQVIISAIPEEMIGVEALKGSELPTILGLKFNLSSRATFYVIKEELRRRWQQPEIGCQDK